MKERIALLKSLAGQMSQEINLVAKELGATSYSDTSKETILENMAVINMVMDDINDSIESSLLCCDDRNLNLEAMERSCIIRALEITGGHMEKTAKCLGVSSRTITRRVYDLSINTEDFKSDKKEYRLLSGEKFVRRYNSIASWIVANPEFWLADLKKSCGYDSDEAQASVNTLIRYLKSKGIIRCCDRKNKHLRYVLSNGVAKQDIMAHFAKS